MYDKKHLKKKAAHIASLFPEIDWPDLFELVPQVMEVSEVFAISRGKKDKDKEKAMKETSCAVISEIVSDVNVNMIDDRIMKAIPLLVDLINDASNGRFAINKEQQINKELQ